jgi:uncharacterized protein (DUF2252 family)
MINEKQISSASANENLNGSASINEVQISGASANEKQISTVLVNKKQISSTPANKKQPRGTSAKKPPRSSPGLPKLDGTQQALVAKLAAGRELWQASGAYEPERPLGSSATRRDAGAKMRESVPHSAHAKWTPPRNRPHPVDTVVAGNEGRQEHLVPLRMGRMAASPFAFLRGSASVMAWDLSHTPVTGMQVVIDGDAHINNFGMYGTPQRDVVADLNDFDEATIGPWEWDLKRLAASVNVAGRANGFKLKERNRAVKKAVRGYRLNMDRLAKMGLLEVWSIFGYAERRPTDVKVPRKAWVTIQKAVSKAKRTNNETLLPKVAFQNGDGKWQFRDEPPILTRVDDETRAKVIAAIVEYASGLAPAYRNMLRRYSVADVAHRVVGVGSVGTRAYLVLLFGNGDSDPLFLQVKEAIVPVHSPYLPQLLLRKEHEHEGRRTIDAQRMLQALGDPMLGSTTIDERPFFVRQMKNMKASVPVELMKGKPFDYWAFTCGALLARAHARCGDADRIAGYCGDEDTLDQALAEFAEAYGNQTERDHAKLVNAIKSGDVKAVVEEAS